MKPCISFCRVSSREQEETGYSLDSQEKLLKDYADRKDFRIAKKFSISESAKGYYKRNAFNEMVAYSKKNNIKIIICEKIDRLTRNLKDAVCINDWINENSEREVHFVKENCILNKDSKSNEKFIWNIKVSVAQYYIDNLSEEVKKGQKEKIAQGWLPTQPPLGYKTVGEKGHKIHIIDKEKASLIKKMFNLYASGEYSLKKLVQKMYKEGLRTRKGNKLCRSRMAELLADPFYFGKIKWNNQIYKGKQEPLINEDLFNSVQQILKSKSTPSYTKHFYLFKRLLRCAKCEGLITWERQRGIIYGHCNGCEKKDWVKEPDIEEQIKPLIENLKIKTPILAESIRDILKNSHKDETEYHTTTLNSLKQQYEQIQKRLDRLYDDKLDEKITKDFYERKFKQYTEEKEAILQAMNKHSKASNKYFELGMTVYELSQKAPELYREATVEEKRELMGLVFDSLILNEGKLEYKYSKLFEKLIKAVEATNCSKAAVLAESQPEIFEQPISIEKRAKMPEFAELLRGQDSNLQPGAYTLS